MRLPWGRKKLEDVADPEMQITFFFTDRVADLKDFDGEWVEYQPVALHKCKSSEVAEVISSAFRGGIRFPKNADGSYRHIAPSQIISASVSRIP